MQMMNRTKTESRFEAFSFRKGQNYFSFISSFRWYYFQIKKKTGRIIGPTIEPQIFDIFLVRPILWYIELDS